jgi:uncharacterized protein YbbC (DUF1343 family)
VPVRFTPTASTFKDQPCGGVQMIVTDRDTLDAVDLGMAIALTVQKLYPTNYALEKVQALLQQRATIDAIKAGKTLDQITRAWNNELTEFKRRRQKYLLY